MKANESEEAINSNSENSQSTAKRSLWKISTQWRKQAAILKMAIMTEEEENNEESENNERRKKWRNISSSSNLKAKK